MSLTFYGAPMSSASLTELVLEELGVPFEKVMLDLKKGESKTPAFLALNPNGKVPCIVHDGTAIWESAAVTIYLGETFGVERKLFPAPGPTRGEAMKWIVWANVSLGDAVGRYLRNTTEWYPADQRNAAAGAAAKTEVDAHLKILDEHLAGTQFLLGADFSLADTHVNALTGWLRIMKFDLSPYVSVNAWGSRCTSRPAFMKVMAAGAT